MAVYVKNPITGCIKQIGATYGLEEQNRVVMLYLSEGYVKIPATTAWHECLTLAEREIVTRELKELDSENWRELLDVWRNDLRAAGEWFKMRYGQGYNLGDVWSNL